ncbi:putative signal transducing protein [Bosea sp. 124]|nr:putative signal transducing protein [Bosea sp. 124]
MRDQPPQIGNDAAAPSKDDDGGLARRRPDGLHRAMHELVRTNDIVLLGAIEALLASANLDCLIADQHISALEGMIGVFPRRLLVREVDRMRARALLIEAGFGGELRDG